MRFSRPHSHLRATGAFTLVEVMIVVAIISLLAAIATPSILRARTRAQNTRFVNDLRVAADAFQQCATEKHRWPLDTNRGVVPPGMETYFSAKLAWPSPTVIGGMWDWDYRSLSGIVAGVTVDEPTADEDQLTEIDKLIDDGDLATGAFRRTSRGYTLQLE